MRKVIFICTETASWWMLLGSRPDIWRELKLSNDICESIIDYLTTAIPNFDQMTCSNFVQAKR